jgi:glycosyltransferase involved in cell wall biosynthesis|tara:strand:+ start:8188 stop:9204 length:1017 start_codon:yes stop_codon:yes gene_type:complete
MKVLQVIDQLGVGGAERVVIDMTNLLHEANIDVSFLALLGPKDQDFEIDSRIPKYYLYRKSKFSFNKLFSLRKILVKYEIIHVHMRHTFRYVQLVSKLFRINSKVILHDHSSDYSVPFLLNTFLKPNYYIGVNNHLINWCKSNLYLDKNVFLLKNIIVKKNITTVRKIDDFVMVGNIKSGKNQLFAIELAYYLNKKLTIIGKVQDQVYYQLLKDKVQDLGIENTITFVHDENNPQKRLNEFKIGLMTSKSESGPLVLIEYLAQSLPFISYNTGSVSNVLADELPDSFVDSFELSEWNKKLVLISKSQIDYKSLYDTYFSPSNYSQECIAIYKDILKNY